MFLPCQHGVLSIENMPVIDLRFQRDLSEQEFGINEIHERHGLAFHRWLPDGEKDAIVVGTKYPDTTLKLWFRRFGFTERGKIEFNLDHNEVDPTIVPKQGLLNSGPLFAKIESFEITDDELKVLQDNKIGGDKYQLLGKKIAKIIDPIMINFFYLLRIHFGQYWLPKYSKYDSTEKSIGEHLRMLFIEWSDVEGKTWNAFEPDNKHATISVEMSSPKSFPKLITKQDWKKLEEYLKEDHKESLAAITLARTHQYIVQRDIRHAFFEGVTSLELSIEEFMRYRIKNNKLFNDNIKGFWALPIRTKIISIATVLDLSTTDIENTVTAISWRNKIIHDGWAPEFYEAKKYLESLLRVTSKLLTGPPFKFPNYGGQVIQPEEMWDNPNQSKF